MERYIGDIAERETADDAWIVYNCNVRMQLITDDVTSEMSDDQLAQFDD